MNKINLILVGFMLLLVGTACEKDRTFVEFDDLDHGAFARELARDGGFFFTAPDDSQIDVSVEFYDINQGRDVASYSWTVEYIDKVNGGADSKPAVDILSIPSTSFGTNADTGLPSASFSFTLNEAMDALGVTIDDITGGSTMRYNATVTMNDGRTFTSANTGNNIVSSAAFKGLFSFDANLLCTSELSGDLDYVTTNGVTGGGGPACPGEITGTITITEDDAKEGVYTVSDASLGVFPACWSDSDAAGITMIDACNIISMEGADQYGDAYTWTIIEISGADMTIEWTNTYGDGGTSVLTRADGADWPPLKN